MSGKWEQEITIIALLCEVADGNQWLKTSLKFEREIETMRTNNCVVSMGGP